MSGFLAIAGRELRAYFFSPMAYVILSLFLVGNGGIFIIILMYLIDPSGPISRITPLQIFFNSFLYWLILLVITPVITMRSISEERRSGTIEMLMTAPVSELQVTLAKYLAALVFYCFLWLPTAVNVAILEYYSEVDWGPVAAGYLGVVGMGAMYLAIGLFGSSFTKNQIVAAVTSFVIGFAFFMLGFVESLFNGGTAQKVLGYMSLLDHMDDFGKGIVDSRHLVYYLSTAALFLFLTSRALEAKKWR